MKKLKICNLPRLNSIIYKPSFSILCFFLALLFYPLSSIAQNRLLPLNKTFDLKQERSILKEGKLFHTAFQPYSESDFQRNSIRIDSIYSLLSLEKRKDLSGWKRKLFYEHLFIVDTQNVKLSLDPIYQFEYTHELDGEGESLFKNSRGFLLQLQLGKNVAVGSSFLENQSRTPTYIANRVDASDVAYGQGRVKRLDTAYYDFSMSSAYLSYSPSEYINLTVGHGKHFIGNGYRSHLLSDLSFNYPYLKLQSKWANGKVHYQNLYSLYQDLERVNGNDQTEELFERKMAASHYLSVILHPDIEIGLFESTVWPSIDSSGRQKIPFNAYMPVLFLNSFIGDDDDVLASNLGLNLRYSPANKLLLYSQLSSWSVNDGLSSYQLGLKYFILDGLRVGLEFNSRKADSTYAYRHYNESLSLPYFGRQDEIIVSAQYAYERWNLLGRSNIYSGDLDQQFIMAELSYMVNPAVNSNIYLNVTQRDVDNLLFISFGWRTSLQNLYFNY